MYRLCSNASRVSHRTWMGARTRRVCEHPSSRHGGAVSEAAVEGTRAWTALGHREVPKKVPTAPLSVLPRYILTSAKAPGRQDFLTPSQAPTSDPRRPDSTGRSSRCAST
jgi:hypothetical protein